MTPRFDGAYSWAPLARQRGAGKARSGGGERRRLVAYTVRNFRPAPTRQGIRSAATIVAISFLASRVLGLLRNTIFAYLFGTSAKMAAYSAAFRIPDLLFTLIAGGALSSAFIPVFAGLLERRHEREAWEIANTILNTLFVAMTMLAAVGFIFAPQMVAMLFPGFPAAQKVETAQLTQIMMVQPILLGLAGVLTAMQQSYGRFLMPAIGPVVYNASIIAGALVFGPRFGVYAAAWAVAAGALLMLEIQFIGLAMESHRYRLHVNWLQSSARQILRLMTPRVIGLGAYQVMLLVTTYLASGLSHSAFNAITYAWALVMFPVGALGSSVAMALFPTIARQSAAAQLGAMRDTLRSSLRSILFLALPATLALIVLAQPVIDLLYRHGVWTTQSTAATSYALTFYALGVVPMTLIEVMPRAFYALHETWTPVAIAVVALLLDAVLSVILIHVFPRSRGQGGLALATAISVWIQGLWLFSALRRRLPGVMDAAFRRAITAMILSLTVGCVVMILSLHEVSRVVSLASTAGAFIQLGVAGIAGAIAYLGTAWLLGLPEARQLPLPRRRRS